MPSNILIGTFETQADLSGRLVIPKNLRKERVFYVSFEDTGLDLYPTSNLSDEELTSLASSRVTLDNQNRVNLSAYCDRYDIRGKSLVLITDGLSIKVLTAKGHQEYEVLNDERVKETLDEYGII